MRTGSKVWHLRWEIDGKYQIILPVCSMNIIWLINYDTYQRVKIFYSIHKIYFDSKLTQSNQKKEGPMFLEFFVLISQYYFFESSIVRNFSSHVIIVIWLTNLISISTLNWHCFELSYWYAYFQVHSCSWFQITKFEKSGTHSWIWAEESPEFICILWKSSSIWDSLIIL